MYSATTVMDTQIYSFTRATQIYSVIRGMVSQIYSAIREMITQIYSAIKVIVIQIKSIAKD